MARGWWFGYGEDKTLRGVQDTGGYAIVSHPLWGVNEKRNTVPFVSQKLALLGRFPANPGDNRRVPKTRR